MRIFVDVFVVGMKLNYLRHWGILVPLDALVVVVVVFVVGITNEICSIGIDDHFGPWVTLHWLQ